MKNPDGSKKVLLVDHVEGQCRAIIGFKNGEPGAPYMCGEPVLRGPHTKMSSWCSYHYDQMHSAPVEQYVSNCLFPIRPSKQKKRAELKLFVSTHGASAGFGRAGA